MIDDTNLVKKKNPKKKQMSVFFLYKLAFFYKFTLLQQNCVFQGSSLQAGIINPVLQYVFLPLALVMETFHKNVISPDYKCKFLTSSKSVRLNILLPYVLKDNNCV